MGQVVGWHVVVDGAGLREKSSGCSRLVSDRCMWGCHATCEGLGQGAL